MGRHSLTPASHQPKSAGSLAAFACPNPERGHFNRFDAGNLFVVEWTGKHKDIRRHYCSACKGRFYERLVTLLLYTKLPEETVARIVECLRLGCSVEATADICDVDPRTVGRVLERAGRRADDFHRLQLDRLPAASEAVQLDELHGHVRPGPGERGGDSRARSVPSRPGSGDARLSGGPNAGDGDRPE